MLLVLCASLLGWPAAASAADDDVLVRCPSLSSEQAAEVEARVRASLLVAELEGRVVVSCQADRAQVEITSSDGSASLEAPITDARPQEALLELVETALRDLAHRRASKPAPSAAPAPARAAPAPSAAPAPPMAHDARESIGPQAPISASTRPVQVLVQGTAELWSSHMAIGPVLGVGRAEQHFWYGAKLGVLIPNTSFEVFNAREWQGALRIGFQPDWAGGLQLALGAGPSLLTLSSQSESVSGASKVRVTWFADANLSYPMWLGDFGLVPGLGARVFGSERGVHVDGQERLRLRGVVPQLNLGLVYRL